MELSKDSKERLQSVAKVGITAVVVGGVAVKIFRKYGQESWGYAHLTDKNANLYLGAVIDGIKGPRQLAGRLLNSGEDVANGGEPVIEWDEGQDETTVDDLEQYIGESAEA